MNEAFEVSLQELPALREKTDRVSRILFEQMSSHFSTLQNLFAPERIYGRFAGARVDRSDSEISLNDLKRRYQEFSKRPFDLPAEFDTQWLTLTGYHLELSPWQYLFSAQGRSITMTCPIRWIVHYRCGITPSQFLQALNGNDRTKTDSFRQFIVNALVLQSVLKDQPGLVRLFADLRYSLQFELLPEFKGLPILVLSANYRSVRPPDDLILAATAFSGVPAFIEIIDAASFASARDPVTEKLNAALK